jgi:dTDP-4-dehydrorhamnose 3,5-epimerase-like enzyme
MMQIERLAIEGILVLVPTRRSDQRGFFSETYRSETVRWYLENRDWWKPLGDNIYSGERLGL